MALPVDPSSALSISQDVLLFDYQGYVIVVPEEFSAESKTLSDLQAKAIAAGAVCSVSYRTRVHMFFGSIGKVKGVCVLANLPPTAREALKYESIGYPLCLVEDNGLVVAGMLWTTFSVCGQFCHDKRLINLLGFTASYDALLNRLHQPAYRRLRPATNSATPHSQTILTQIPRDATLLLSGPELKRQCTQPKPTPSLAVELEQLHDNLVQKGLHRIDSSAPETVTPSHQNQSECRWIDSEPNTPLTLALQQTHVTSSHFPSLYCELPTQLQYEQHNQEARTQTGRARRNFDAINTPRQQFDEENLQEDSTPAIVPETPLVIRTDHDVTTRSNQHRAKRKRTDPQPTTTPAPDSSSDAEISQKRQHNAVIFHDAAKEVEEFPFRPNAQHNLHQSTISNQRGNPYQGTIDCSVFSANLYSRDTVRSTLGETSPWPLDFRRGCREQFYPFGPTLNTSSMPDIPTGTDFLLEETMHTNSDYSVHPTVVHPTVMPPLPDTEIFSDISTPIVVASDPIPFYPLSESKDDSVICDARDPSIKTRRAYCGVLRNVSKANLRLLLNSYLAFKSRSDGRATLATWIQLFEPKRTSLYGPYDQVKKKPPWWPQKVLYKHPLSLSKIELATVTAYLMIHFQQKTIEKINTDGKLCPKLVDFLEYAEEAVDTTQLEKELFTPAGMTSVTAGHLWERGGN